jgi:hypothetical protein
MKSDRTLIVTRLVFLFLFLASGDGDAAYFVRKTSGVRSQIPSTVLHRRLWQRSAAPLLRHVIWEKLEQGLSFGTITFERGDTSAIKIYLLNIDPVRFGFKVIGKAGPGRAVADLTRAHQCIAGINGGYFYYKGGNENLRMPLGLTVQDGNRVAAYKKNYSGCFYASDKQAGIVFKKRPPKDADQVLQSFPMLIYSGKIPAHLKEEAKTRLHIHRRHRRAAVGQDWDGNIVFLITDKPLSFFELAFLCGGLGFMHCLSLDGGGSSQMAVFSQKTIVVPGYDTVPFGIGIYNR